MAEKLTTEYIRTNKKAPPAGVRDVYDTRQPGLVLRLRPSGKHSFRVALGRGRWHTLGSADDLRIEQARGLAQSVRGDVAKAKALGEDDPVAARQRAAKAPTFAAFVAEHYEPWASANRRTGPEQAKRLVAIFGPLFGSKALDQISAFEVERWRSARLKDGAAPSTINRNLNILRAALRLAVRWKVLRKYALDDVRASKVDASPRVRYLDDAEEKRLRAALATRDSGRRAERDSANRWRRERGYEEWPPHGVYTDHLTPIVLLALNTGLRRGELFNLRWRDVCTAGAMLTVDGGGAKSGQTRHVPLNDEAVSVLTTWRGPQAPADPEGHVFPNAEGGRLEDIKGSWLPIVVAARLKAFRFHDVRHSFASNLVMRGVDLNTVRELLGHADLKMTLKYAHLGPERKAAAVALLASNA